MTNAKDVLDIFPGAKVIAENKPLFCKYCDKDLIPEWDQLHQDAPVSKLVKLLERRRGRIVERVWSDGHRDWMCHGCGREVEK
jgi:hypothetical protein